MNWLESIEITNTDALIVVDVQYDFLEGGSLEVPDGNQVIPGINQIGELFKEKAKRIIFTQSPFCFILSFSKGRCPSSTRKSSPVVYRSRRLPLLQLPILQSAC